MNIEKITWTAEIDGKKYGSAFRVGDIDTNKQVLEVVGVIAKQMKMSLQKIVTGESDGDIQFAKAKELYKRIQSGELVTFDDYKAIRAMGL